MCDERVTARMTHEIVSGFRLNSTLRVGESQFSTARYDLVQALRTFLTLVRIPRAVANRAWGVHPIDGLKRATDNGNDGLPKKSLRLLNPTKNVQHSARKVE